MNEVRSELSPEDLTGRDLPAQVGRYRVLDILGQGGMARVFRAELIGTGSFKKQCALKVIHKSVVGKDPLIQQLLINEATLGGLLKHPNIVDTYDCGEIGGQPYIAMEMIYGRGVDEFLGEEGALPPSIAMAVSLQVCAALDHAHNLVDGGTRANLVHRDLKPSNIMLTRDGLTKLMDFGIAKASNVSGATTKTGMTKGTLQYMSPEQLNGKELDARSDLFGMGAILYELFCGRRLFRADNPGAIMLKIVTADDSLDEIGVFDEADEVVDGLGTVIRRCIRQHPDDRYDSAMELRRALKALGFPPADTEDVRMWVRDRLPASALGTGEVPSLAETPSIGDEPFTPVGPTRPVRPVESSPTLPIPGATRPMDLPPAPTSVRWLKIGAGGAAGALAAFLLWSQFGTREDAVAVEPGSVLDPVELEEVASAATLDAATLDLADAGVASMPPEPATDPVAAEVSTAAPSPVRDPAARRTEPVEAATPAPTPAPTPPPAPALSLADAGLPASGRRGTTATFAVRVTGGEGVSAKVNYRPPQGSWSSLRLRRSSGATFAASLKLRPHWGQQEVVYYVVAKDGGSTQLIGSIEEPLVLKVR